MSNIELSGVLRDSDLHLTLSPGPSPASGTQRGLYFWPEISPGYFRAGDFTIHNNIDYLYGREGRLVFGPVTGSAIPDKEIPKLHGPTLVAFYPTSGSSGLVNSCISEATTGWVSRNSSWKEMIYAPCRNRLYKIIPSWTLLETLSNGSKIYSYTVPSETYGYGETFTPLLTRLSDEKYDWMFFGLKADLESAGTPGAKEWAVGSSGNFLILCAPGTTPPSRLYGSWIAGQASLYWEELAITTTDGIPITVPTKYSISDIEVQFLNGVVTGGTATAYSTFPRLITTTGNIEANLEVIVRYKPTGIYGTTPGSSGVMIAVTVPESSVVCVRYEKSSPEEKFSAGNITRDGINVSTTLSPLTSSPGFFIAVSPEHNLHSSQPSSGSWYRRVSSDSKLLAWATPTVMYKYTGPSKLKLLALGGDGVPLSNINISITGSSSLTIADTSVYTNNQGEAFTEITRSLSATGTPSVTASIYNGATLVDNRIIYFTMGSDPSEQSWVENLLAGEIKIELLEERAKSGFSRRRQLAIWKVQGDGLPSHLSNNELTVTCSEGRLFSNINERFTSSPQGGGKELKINFASVYTDWDNPIILEYEPSLVGEPDIIRAVWSGGSYPTSYGYLKIGKNV